MRRYVKLPVPELDKLVDDTIDGIGKEIDSLGLPLLAGVVLGGGYGRGEGGAFLFEGAKPKLSNDLDFYVVVEDGADEDAMRNISSALAPVSAKWTEKLGVDVDFCPPKTFWRIKHDEARLMIQELVRGYVDVAGRKGEDLFKEIVRCDSDRLPVSEAARLMANRGAGLLMAKEPSRSADFVNRNINKAILGAGDAKLIAQGRYKWRLDERTAECGDGLYAMAAEWKIRPDDKAVCSREDAKAYFLSAMREITETEHPVYGPVSKELGKRSFRQAARWLVRRKTFGEVSTFGMDAVARLCFSVCRAVENDGPFAASLRRDWEVFN